MKLCNILYDKVKSLKLLINSINLLYRIIKSSPDSPKSEQIVRNSFRLYHKKEEGTNKLFLLSDINDEISQDFIRDVKTAISGIDLNTFNNLSDTGKRLYQIIMSEFFDMNAVEMPEPTVAEVEKEQLTDTDRNIRLKISLEDDLYDIYGPICTGLIKDLTNNFEIELRRLLIYNDFENIKYELSNQQVNQRITLFKNNKFKNILNFLKKDPRYQNDTTLLSINGMYLNGLLDYNNYFYVLDIFLKLLKEELNLNDKLNNDLKNKLLQTHLFKQEETYKRLIDLVLNDPSLKVWFNNKFNTNYLNNEAKNKLFLLNQFSNYYLEIKNKLIKEIEKNPNIYYKNSAESFIESIEHPENNLLDYVLDYISLIHFDTLFIDQLGDSFTIEKNFIKGFEPTNQVALKYIIKKSKKHQNAGWETSNKEGAEDHTSSTVKNILETMFIYKYNENNQLIPKTLNMTSLMHAWQNFINEVLSDKVSFDSPKNLDIKDTLKTLINTLLENVFDNIRLILSYLFDPGKVSYTRYRLIDLMYGEDIFTEDDKNVLYSFYNQVLNLNNPNSKLSKELDRFNDTSLYSVDFTNISADLISLLYRNVNNNFIDCDLKSGDFKVKAKFNWDSTLFDMVERMAYKSKIQVSKLLGQTVLNEYQYKTVRDSSNSYISTITISDRDGVEYDLGFSYQLGDNNIYGLFSRDNLVHLVSTQLDNKTILDSLAEIDLNSFKLKIFDRRDTKPQVEKLNNKELVLFKLLKLFDTELQLNILTDKGLDTLQLYKKHYKVDSKNYIYSKNYLEHFLRLAIRILDVNDLALMAGDLNFKEFIKTDSKYASLYEYELKIPQRNVLSFNGPLLFFYPTTSKDVALSNYAKCDAIISGQSIKHNSLNKLGASVANYGISRLGSELNRRLQKQRNQGGVFESLLFVNNLDQIDVDPVVDSEITTLIGKVKSVREMTSAELFSHAIFDKFYLSFINSDKICFQPTVYSDKTNFLNYRTKLRAIFGADPLKLTDCNSKFYQDIYKNTFFAAHNKIRSNVVNKIYKLVQYFNTTLKELITSEISENKYQTVKAFLRSKTDEELLDLVKIYNQTNEDKIELESEKDFRVRKVKKVVNNKEITEIFCDLNEVVEYYANLYENEKLLTEYVEALKKNYLQDLKENDIPLKLFNSKNDKNKWIEDKLKDRNKSYLVRILSSDKLLEIDDRKDFLEKWLDSKGCLKLEDDNHVMNPLFEKFFYIEGICSNNLRVSLSGSEVNHPDKAKDTLFNKVKKLINKYQLSENTSDLDLVKRDLINLLVINNIIKDNYNIDELITDFKNVDDINDLEKSTGISLSIYQSSMLDIINTAEGTLFKRNVIIPATLLHPLTGLINGMDTETIVAVVDDMIAPVSNLRGSDEIEAQDGSAHMSSIEVILENNSLGDQRVGTNRKPIWDDQSEDGTSFLAKFAAFGITNAKMLQSIKSNASLFILFKKMHNLQWAPNMIDLTSNIHNVQGQKYVQSEVTRWFKQAILGNKKLYYKDKYGSIVLVVNFGKDLNGYFTEEQVLGQKPVKVYHYFDNQSNHYTEKPLGIPVHTINSLYELFIAIGGIHCVNDRGNLSEFSHEVLTNFVINVGYRKKKVNEDGKTLKKKIDSIKDIYLPLKRQFVSYVFNQTAVKNGARNLNKSDVWTDPSKSLNTFVLSTLGLGILLNADHDVVDSELTEFSQVVAACAAYGKKYNFIHEIYYSLGLSALEASREELDNILEFIDINTTNPSKAKYKLYKIISNLILSSKSNNDLDLTEKVKLEIRKEFKVNKDNQSDLLKIPFSDPSIYTLFITNITSVINKKSIKRKHPGSGYVMSPAYNVIQYFLYFDPKTKTYRKYFYLDLLNRARTDFKGKLLNALKLYAEKNKIDLTNVQGLNLTKVHRINLLKALEVYKLLKVDESFPVDYISINSLDTDTFNNNLVELYLLHKQEKEPYRPQEWFQPCDIVLVYNSENKPTGEILDLSNMADYQAFIKRTYTKGTKFKICVTKPNNLKPSLTRWKYLELSINNLEWLDIASCYKVDIKESSYGSFRYPGVILDSIQISLHEDPSKIFELVKEKDASGNLTNKWQIHFRTGIEVEGKLKLDPNFSDNLKKRLFNAAMEVLPVGSTLTLVPNKEDDLEKGVGLTKGSISGFKNLINRSGRAVLSKTSTKINTNFKIDDKNIELQEYVKVGNNELHYMNIFSHPIISKTWDKTLEEKPTQAEIQKVLDDLDKGFFYINDKKYNIIKGSLENSEAELVLGNMYKDLFKTGNKSLADILDEGEDFFKYQETVPELPKGNYQLAFVKNNGQHVLITLGTLEENEHYVELPFDVSKEVVKDNEIYEHEGGIKIGKYIPSTWVEYEGKVYTDHTYSEVVDPSKYKLIVDNNGVVESILKRVEYIKKYKYSKVARINGEELIISYIEYKISPFKTIREALSKRLTDLGEQELTASDVYGQISKILKDLYELDHYVDILINNSRDFNEDIRKSLSNALFAFGRDVKFNKESQLFEKISEEEISKLPLFTLHIIKLRLLLLKKDFAEKYKSFEEDYFDSLNLYKKQYSSFLDSLHFISSRIPALSLQSFMPMICVGWTADTSNTAYVSYILTYLQGSDYDIDKAYIMGQSYGDNSIYVGWSNLFDYSSYETLKASKTLPVPRGIKLEVVDDLAYNIDRELENIIYSKGAEKILNYSVLITKLNSFNGKYIYTKDKNFKIKLIIIDKIQKHLNYKAPYRYRELMYKNVASSNIKNVVHDIRNRDQAYSPITMKDLANQAKLSPKGAKTKTLNMVNPLTKYIMLNQNLVGKDVIGIAANGEKDWFNLTYYYHNLLRSNDPHDLYFLNMNHTFSRILGRSNGVNNIKEKQVKHIPDLWNADAELASKIKELFYKEGEIIDTSDAYVDLLISLLLSAATDNAKELILAKINAGTNLAKYHLHLMMMGFSLDDIVSFMTCPVVELIDKYSNENVYNLSDTSINKTIKLLRGKLDLSKILVKPFVHKTYDLIIEELEILLELIEAANENGFAYTEVKYSWVIKELLPMFSKVSAESLEDFILKYIEAKTNLPENPSEILKELSEYTFPETDNYNTNYLFNYVDNIINNINLLIESFNSEVRKYNRLHPDNERALYTFDDFYKDLNEFENLTDLANETSTLASVWLKFNQGIPQTDIELIKRIKLMIRTVSDKETKFGIKPIYKHKKNGLLLIDEKDSKESSLEDEKEALKQKFIENLLKIKQGITDRSVSDIVSKILKNNPSLPLDTIILVLIDAVKTDLYCNFDIYKFLEDTKVILKEEETSIHYYRDPKNPDEISYRDLAATYFNLIKSSWNILDIVNRIPHYNAILDLLNYSVLERKLFSLKSKLIDELINLGDLNYMKLTEKDYKELNKYADKILITSYMFSKGETPISLKTVIDDAYNKAGKDERNPRKNIVIYDSYYKEVEADEIHLDTLNGLDSFKVFVEGVFTDWLRNNYGENPLVKELINTSNHGQDVIRTTLDLSKILDSLLNTQIFNRYLLGMRELEQILFDKHYTVADILMLYNLLLNGTRLGGKYLTAIFTDSVYKKTPIDENDLLGTVLYDYYYTLANLDYMESYKYILPTKKDFLIFMAPFTSNLKNGVYMKDPYIKVRKPDGGFDIHKKLSDGVYNPTPEDLLGLSTKMISEDDRLLRLYNYTLNSLFLFPELHRRMSLENIFKDDDLNDLTLDELESVFLSFIRLNKIIVYKLC